jgi:hypothetical protein
MLAEAMPEWGTTALDPLYRLQTIRNLDDFLLADQEVMEVGP